MGTETVAFANQIQNRHFLSVKLNNPLMGTETIQYLIYRVSNNSNLLN